MKVVAHISLSSSSAYKYDSLSESGINLHADQAAVNVNLWLSLEDADIEEPGFGGGLVVYTAKPPEDMSFSAYNTNTDVVVDKILRPTNFANVTVKHKPNRAVSISSSGVRCVVMRHGRPETSTKRR